MSGGRSTEGSRAQPSRNGGSANGNGHTPSPGGVGPADLVQIVGRAASAIAREAQARVPRADLDERDPDYIRESLPGLWLLASLWFRAEVRNLERIPAEGPVLLVGNHSGGNLTPDTGAFTLA